MNPFKAFFVILRCSALLEKAKASSISLLRHAGSEEQTSKAYSNEMKNNIQEETLNQQDLLNSVHRESLSTIFRLVGDEAKSRNVEASDLYKCGEIIATLNVDEAKEFVADRTGDDTLGNAITSAVQYGVQVKVVCGSCESINADDKPSNEAFERFCGSEAYGHDHVQSGLVMIPMVEDKSSGDLIPLKGTLKGFIHARTTKIARYDVPSQLWDSDFSIEILLSLVATARGGAVSFAPDFMGYGYSESVKSYLVSDSYVTSTLPLWMKVGAELGEETSKATMLGDAVFLEGYSEGGKKFLQVFNFMNFIEYSYYNNEENMFFNLTTLRFCNNCYSRWNEKCFGCGNCSSEIWSRSTRHFKNTIRNCEKWNHY